MTLFGPSGKTITPTELDQLKSNLLNYGIFMAILLEELGGEFTVSDRDVMTMYQRAVDDRVQLEFCRNRIDNVNILKLVEVDRDTEEPGDDGPHGGGQDTGAQQGREGAEPDNGVDVR